MKEKERAPSPWRAAVRMLSRRLQAIHSGGCGFCFGLGSTLRCGMEKKRPCQPANGSSTNMRGMACSASSHCACFRLRSMPKAPSSACDVDSPVPNSTRPPESRSSVAMRSATRAGWLKAGGSCTMPCPAGCAASAGWRPPGTPPARSSANIPPGNGAPPPRRSRSPGRRQVRSGPARPPAAAPRRPRSTGAATGARRRGRTSSSVALLVAVGAIQAGLVGPVAGHTAAHGDVRFPEQPLPLRHLAVAGLADGPRRQVLLVAEIHVAGDLVDAHPGDLTVLPGERRQLLDGRDVRFDRLVTGHALRGRRDSHHLPGVRHFVAVLALEAQRQVLLVAIGNGLFRRLAFLLRAQRQRQGHEQRQPPHQIALVRICSARYSEERMASARMVRVGFWHPPETNELPSTTNRLRMSWVCWNWFSTEVLGLSPMRQAPSSWILSPGGTICASLAISYSFSPYFCWMCSTGMPQASVTSLLMRT